MDDRLEIGCVVYSKMGRDAGRYYCVVGKDKDFVLIADGDLRMLKSPKKKNIKHVKSNGVSLDVIAEKIKVGKKVFDSELKSALRAFNDKGGINVER